VCGVEICENWYSFGAPAYAEAHMCKYIHICIYIYLYKHTPKHVFGRLRYLKKISVLGLLTWLREGCERLLAINCL